VEAIIMAVVMITHSCYGHNASGGPVGVGEAAGRSMRFSPILVVPPFAVLAPYGVNPNFALTVQLP
jgi:phospholipid/cholesterol/gamma-HCH transport system permease protein